MTFHFHAIKRNGSNFIVKIKERKEFRIKSVLVYDSLKRKHLIRNKREKNHTKWGLKKNFVVIRKYKSKTSSSCIWPENKKEDGK